MFSQIQTIHKIVFSTQYLQIWDFFSQIHLLPNIKRKIIPYLSFSCSWSGSKIKSQCPVGSNSVACHSHTHKRISALTRYIFNFEIVVALIFNPCTLFLNYNWLLFSDVVGNINKSCRLYCVGDCQIYGKANSTSHWLFVPL